MQTDRHSNENEESLEDIVAEYVERLNHGQKVMPEEVFLDYPEIAQDILDQLEAFVGLSEAPNDAPLGTLGDYTLRRQIGRGGMGVVYEAWENSMDRAVALKVLPAGVAADDRAVTRFVQEARLAGKLNHPNVVGVYGMGVKDQTPYYAMEFVEGETLAQVLAKTNDAESDTDTPFGKKASVVYFGNLADAFADVADGLQHAHSKGVVHRDIKPSNLILDGDGRLRILDFGLARLEGQESLTISGDFVGTPLYMSPEQARRKKIEVDHRTDVYSLGATMYETICGRPPFRGKDHADTLSQIIERDPVEPRKLDPRVPKDLETIVLKTLRKEVGDRYGTAEALGQDLRRFVRGDPIEARPQSGWEKLARNVRRYRLRIASAATLLCVVGALGWLLHLNQTAEDEANRARYNDVVLEAIKSLHGRQVAASGTRLGDLYLAIQSENPRSEELAKGSIQHRLREIADTVTERPEAPYYLARFLFRRGEEEEARRWIEISLLASPDFVPARLLRERISGGVQVTLEEAIERVLPEFLRQQSWQRQWLLAQQHSLTGASAEAVKAYGYLLSQMSREGEPFTGSRIDAHLGRGLAALDLDQYDLAIRDFQAAAALGGRFPMATFLLGDAYAERGVAAEAESVFEEFYQGAPRENRSRAAFLVACVRDRSDRWRDRLDELDRKRLECEGRWGAGDFEKAHEIAAEILEQDRNDLFGLLYGGLALVGLQDKRGGPRWDRARAEALGLARRAADVYPNSVVALSLLSTALRVNGDSDGALRAAERTLRTAQRLCTEPSGGHQAMALILLERGDIEAAEKHARAALTHMPGHWMWRLTLALVLEADGRYDKAAAEYRELGDARGVWFASWPLSRLAGILIELGDYEEAAQVAREATEHPLPRNNGGFDRLALALWKGGHPDEALAAAAEGIERLPDRPALHRVRAGVLEESGDISGAAAALVEVLLLAPSDKEAHERLRKLLDRKVSVPVRKLRELEDRLSESIRGSPSTAAQETLDRLIDRRGKETSGRAEERQRKGGR